jgi:hypothetical protein
MLFRVSTKLEAYDVYLRCESEFEEQLAIDMTNEVIITHKSPIVTTPSVASNVPAVPPTKFDRDSANDAVLYFIV